MYAGFTVLLEGADARCELVPTRFLSHARRGGVAAVLMGKLYYRRDALAGLETSGAASDAELALASYLRHGPAGLERLEGDFCAAVWDGRTRRLFALRDPMGGYPLYWVRQGNTFALGTGMGRLLQILERRRVDRAFLAELLASHGQRNDAPDERCAYEGVSRVMGGEAIVYDLAADALTRRTYWDWEAKVEDPGAVGVEEAGALYAARLRAAVRERLDGPTAVHLSGGMDSTGLALVADDLVTQGQGAGPLCTLSVVYDRVPKLAAERPYVEAGIGQLKTATAHRLGGDDLLDFDGFADAPAHDEPYAGLWRIQMDRALLRAAAGAGAATAVSGIGADEQFDVKPVHLADLLRRGRLLSAWADAGRWAAAMNSTRWMVLREFGLGCLPLGRRLAGRRTGVFSDRAGDRPPWLTAAFARDFDLPGRAARQLETTFGRSADVARSLTLCALAVQRGDPVRWEVAVPLGLHLSHPFHDPRLVRLALGIQARVRPEPGRLKPVLAAALRGALPAEIRDRRGKGHFDEMYYRGLGEELRRLEDLVRSSDDLGVFDRDALLRHLEEASLGGPNARQLLGLDLALDVLLWLDRQDAWHAAVPRPSLVLPWAVPLADSAA